MWRRENFTPSIHCHPSYNPAVRCVDSLCGTVQYMCTYRTGDRNASNSAKEDRRASKSSCTQKGRKRLTVNSTSDIFTTSRKWVVSFPCFASIHHEWRSQFLQVESEVSTFTQAPEKVNECVVELTVPSWCAPQSPVLSSGPAPRHSGSYNQHRGDFSTEPSGLEFPQWRNSSNQVWTSMLIYTNRLSSHDES